MKKVVFAVYHNVNHEARSREVLDCCRKLGKVDFVTIARPNDVEDVNLHLIDKRSPIALLKFIAKIKKVCAKVQPDIVVLHDNDCAATIPFIKRRCPKAKIVYDSSELYIPMEGKRVKRTFSNGILIVIKQVLSSFRRRAEKKHLKKADLVFAANIERAQIMKEYFGLSTLPSVFDNVHRIDDDYDKAACDAKWGEVFADDCFNVLFGGGISEERQTFDYIDSYKKLDGKYRLIILGAASDVAKSRFTEETRGRDDIFYLGYMTRAELRYCLQKASASVVLFDKKSYNTLYCASGKLYESLFEGTPILASENPPLKRLCTEHGIGVSTDDFARGIQDLEAKYDECKAAVRRYTATINMEERAQALYREINEKISY